LLLRALQAPLEIFGFGHDASIIAALPPPRVTGTGESGESFQGIPIGTFLRK